MTWQESTQAWNDFVGNSIAAIALRSNRSEGKEVQTHVFKSSLRVLPLEKEEKMAASSGKKAMGPWLLLPLLSRRSTLLLLLPALAALLGTGKDFFPPPIEARPLWWYFVRKRKAKVMCVRVRTEMPDWLSVRPFNRSWMKHSWNIAIHFLQQKKVWMSWLWTVEWLKLL